MTATDMATRPEGESTGRGLFGWTWRETRGFLFVLPWLFGRYLPCSDCHVIRCFCSRPVFLFVLLELHAVAPCR